MKKQSSLYRHHMMDKHVSGISRIMSWHLPRTSPPSPYHLPPTSYPSPTHIPPISHPSFLPVPALQPSQQHPCTKAASQPCSSPCSPAALQQPLQHPLQPTAREPWGRRGNVWWRPSLAIPCARRASRARARTGINNLPRARFWRSYDILRTPHGGLCNLYCPQHRNPYTGHTTH